MSFKDVTGESFKKEVLDYEGLVLVDFWAEWCGPCKTMLANLEDLEEVLDGQIKIVKVEPFKNQDLADAYNIRSVPTLIVFKGGDKIDVKTGAMNKHTLSQWLDAMIESTEPY